MQYRNRKDAGRFLAEILMDYANHPDVVVLGLPRGGVPVAFEVAKALRAPLDVMIVRKLGIPDHKEYAMGAIASGGIRILNQDAVRSLDIPNHVVETVTAQECAELNRRERLYRGLLPHQSLQGKTVIIVDDGLATGSTMLAAVAAVRQQNPGRVIVAVPVGAHETCTKIRDTVDDLVCGYMPEPFDAVGYWYDEFPQTTDDEVIHLLKTSCNLRESAAFRMAFQ